MIIENKDSLWAQWVNKVRLKGKSIWEIGIDKSDSWGWKTMLKIKDSIKEHIWYIIGNAIYDARIKDNVVIADMVAGDKWKWPDDWLSKFPILSTINPPILQKDKEDVVLWINNNDQKVQFTTNQAWKTMREDWPTV
ncbi:hypothetical protein Tco_1439674 [Tanacetum coccineum]